MGLSVCNSPKKEVCMFYTIMFLKEEEALLEIIGLVPLLVMHEDYTFSLTLCNFIASAINISVVVNTNSEVVNYEVS